MPTVLITGAGRGLGLEFARQYAGEGWRVIATIRDITKAADLKDAAPQVEIHSLDVTDHAALAALGRTLASDEIDVVIANAGISRGREMAIERIDETAWLDSIRVNTIAPLATAAALLPALRRGNGKRLIAISSVLGSIGANQDGGHYIYRSSKAALNACWRSLALDHRDIIAVALHPGWVKTDMGGASAPVVPKDSITGMRRVIQRLSAKDSGKFFDYNGHELPW
jgi:NAD(P)-dependent dehydrogenase (short-subunit alcohol dehydrogenase family)